MSFVPLGYCLIFAVVACVCSSHCYEKKKTQDQTCNRDEWKSMFGCVSKRQVKNRTATSQFVWNICKKIWMNYVKMRGISIDGTRPNLNFGAHYLQMDRTNAFERAKEAARWGRWRVIYIRLSLTIDRRRCLHLCHQNNLQFFSMNWSIHCLSNQVTSYLSFTCNACIWFVRQKFNVPPHSTHSKLRLSRIQIDYLFSLF